MSFLNSLNPRNNGDNYKMLIRIIAAIITLWAAVKTEKPTGFMFSFSSYSHQRFCRWFFNGVWMTAIVLKSHGLFSEFWSISMMLSSGRYLLVLWFLSAKVPLPKRWGLLRAQPLQSTVNFMLHRFFSSLARSRYLSFFPFLLILLCYLPGCKVHYSLGSFFFVDYHYV